MDVVKNI
ncbi:hypothetical protein AVEN_123651-1, partial [Araneus ventricosus]